MKDKKRGFFNLNEISSREFDFSVLIIMLCVTFRNYFRGYGFAIHLNSDLFFEMTLLLLPISLLFFNKSNDVEVANILKSYKSLLFPFLGSLIFMLLSWGLLYITKFMWPFVDVITTLLGLIFLIAGILNLLITILIFVTKKRVKS